MLFKSSGVTFRPCKVKQTVLNTLWKYIISKHLKNFLKKEPVLVKYCCNRVQNHQTIKKCWITSSQPKALSIFSRAFQPGSSPGTVKTSKQHYVTKVLASALLWRYLYPIGSIQHILASTNFVFFKISQASEVYFPGTGFFVLSATTDNSERNLYIYNILIGW